MFGIIVLVLLRELQIELGLGAALLMLLHVAAAALVAYKLRGGMWHRRRKQHEERTGLVPREVNSSPQNSRAVGDEKGDDADRPEPLQATCTYARPNPTE